MIIATNGAFYDADEFCEIYVDTRESNGTTSHWIVGEFYNGGSVNLMSCPDAATANGIVDCLINYDIDETIFFADPTSCFNWREDNEECEFV